MKKKETGCVPGRGVSSLVLLACVMAQQASAADSGLFAGVGGGYSSVDGTADTEPNQFTQFPPPDLSVDGISFDDDDSTLAAFAGYNFNRHVGVELGYAQLGEFDSELLGNRASLAAETWTLSGRFRYPLTERLMALWFAGVSRVSFDAEGSIAVLVSLPPFQPPSILSVPLRDPDDETGWTWGVGFGWQVFRNLAVGLEYRQHRVNVIDVETVNLTLTWVQ